MFGLRLLLVANIVLVTAAGALCFIYYERPEAYVFSGCAWCLDAVLVGLVPRTDPYRRRRPHPRSSDGAGRTDPPTSSPPP